MTKVTKPSKQKPLAGVVEKAVCASIRYQGGKLDGELINYVGRLIEGETTLIMGHGVGFPVELYLYVGGVFQFIRELPWLHSRDLLFQVARLYLDCLEGGKVIGFPLDTPEALRRLIAEHHK